MRLQDKIHNKHLNESILLQVLNNSTGSINWLGSRIVIAKSYEDSAYLNDIAVKLLNGDYKASKNPQDKSACFKKIDNLYMQADQAWQRSNPITYSIGYVSRFIFEGYKNTFWSNLNAPRWQIHVQVQVLE